MFETLSDYPTPGYITQAIPYFMVMLFLEIIIRHLKGMKAFRLNDGLMSISHGIMMMCVDMLDKGVRVAIYCYVYEHYKLVSLPWDSMLTWAVAALAVDFFYYWAHRAVHEINIFWAWHQVHHSAEDYNLTTALRQSSFQHFGSFLVNLPMALFVPPTAMLVHSEFNLLYQFWIHSEVVGDLGPLEHVLNTSNHHRVHHGSDRYCLDKNYAGVLIIWDRMFGTFEWYRPNESLSYGLVDQPQFFNPLKHQLFYMKHVFEKSLGMKSWSDKISAFLKGPGWFPGTERLGDLSMVPEHPVRKVYDPQTSMACNLYAVCHFLAALGMFSQLEAQNLDQTTLLLLIGFIIWTLTSIGLIFDNSSSAWASEFVRLALFTLAFNQPLLKFWNALMVPSSLVTAFYGISLLLASIGTAMQMFTPKSKMS